MQMKKVKRERTKEDIHKAKIEIQRAKHNTKKQEALQQLITDMPVPIKFVEQKNLAVTL